jgi:hypothetical protein
MNHCQGLHLTCDYCPTILTRVNDYIQHECLGKLKLVIQMNEHLLRQRELEISQWKNAMEQRTLENSRLFNDNRQLTVMN